MVETGPTATLTSAPPQPTLYGTQPGQGYSGEPMPTTYNYPSYPPNDQGSAGTPTLYANTTSNRNLHYNALEPLNNATPYNSNQYSQPYITTTGAQPASVQPYSNMGAGQPSGATLYTSGGPQIQHTSYNETNLAATNQVLTTSQAPGLQLGGAPYPTSTYTPYSQQTSYPPTQYPANQYPRTQYPTSQYPANQYPSGSRSPSYTATTQYPTNLSYKSTYPTSQYPVNSYPGSQYPASQYPASLYPNSQYPNSQYPGGYSSPQPISTQNFAKDVARGLMQKYDSSRTGTISKQDTGPMLQTVYNVVQRPINIGPREQDGYHHILDVDRDGRATLQDLENLCIKYLCAPGMGGQNLSVAERLFRMYDKQRNGYLTSAQVPFIIEETYRQMGRHYNPTQFEANEWVRFNDQNRDLKVDYPEFENLVLRSLARQGITETPDNRLVW